MKWVSGFPQNLDKGLPYISGLLILNDPETGFPIAVMGLHLDHAGNAPGAATAVAATRMARPESSSVGIVACGVQGRSNLEALSCRFPLKHVRAYDVVPEVAERFAAEMSEQLDLQIEVVSTPREAVCGLDIVVTPAARSRQAKPVDPSRLAVEGSFACPLDFDSYFSSEAFAEADLLATDDHRQFGYYKKVGYFSDTPEPEVDLGQLLNGGPPVAKTTASEPSPSTSAVRSTTWRLRSCSTSRRKSVESARCCLCRGLGAWQWYGRRGRPPHGLLGCCTRGGGVLAALSRAPQPVGAASSPFH